MLRSQIRRPGPAEEEFLRLLGHSYYNATCAQRTARRFNRGLLSGRSAGVYPPRRRAQGTRPRATARKVAARRYVHFHIASGVVVLTTRRQHHATKNGHTLREPQGPEHGRRADCGVNGERQRIEARSPVSTRNGECGTRNGKPTDSRRDPRLTLLRSAQGRPRLRSG